MTNFEEVIKIFTPKDELEDSVKEPVEDDTEKEDIDQSDQIDRSELEDSKPEYSEPEDSEPEDSEPEDSEQPKQTEVEYLFRAARKLAEKGLIEVPDDFQGTAEELDRLLDSVSEKAPMVGARMLFDSLPDDTKELVAYSLQGGKDLETFFKLKNQKVELSKLDPDNPDHAKDILTYYYKKTTSYTPDKIERLIERLEKTGKESLIEEAVDAYAELKDIVAEEERAAIERQREEESLQQRQIEEYRHSVISTINSKVKDHEEAAKIQRFLLNTVTYQDGTTTSRFGSTLNNILQNPEHLIGLATILVKYYDDNKGFDFSKLETRMENLAVDRLKKKLNSDNLPKNVNKTEEDRPKDGLGWLKYVI